MAITEVDVSTNGEKVTSSRERILQAAKHLFARNGYENTSTVAIARDAGTSESQLMKHFGSKQGLLIAILDRGWTGILERVQAIPAGTARMDRVFGMLEAVALELEHDLELKELMTLESRRIRKDSRDVVMSRGCRQFTELLDTVLTQMRSGEELREDLNVEAVRAALLGMVEGLLRDQVVAKRADQQASYGFDDLRRLLHLFLPALCRDERSLKCANG